MNYNEWLDTIELIKKSNRNRQYLEKMINAEDNKNINELLEEKLLDLINYKLNKAINKITININEIFHNTSTIDFSLNDFKKDIKYIKNICNLKQISNNTRERLLETIYQSSDKVYEIIIKKSLEIDRTGMYKSIINKTRIKKEDIYEI